MADGVLRVNGVPAAWSAQDATSAAGRRLGVGRETLPGEPGDGHLVLNGEPSALVIAPTVVPAGTYCLPGDN